MNSPTVESINAVAARWTEIVWAVSWQFCVLGLVVLVVHWSLRSAAPNWRYWLWQILAVKLLLMPFWTATAPWKIPSKSPATEFIAKSPHDDATRVTVSTNPVNASEVLPQRSTLGASQVIRPRPPIAKRDSHPSKATGSLTKNSPAERTRQVRPLISDPSPHLAMNRDARPSAPSDSDASVLAPQLEATTTQSLSWQAWLMFAWAGGVAWLAGRIVWQGISLSRRLHATEPADSALIQRVREVATRLGMPRIPGICVIDLDVSPFVCGLWRTRLVLPRGLAESFTPEQLDLVLLHELAHVRRRDLAWGWIPEIGRVLFFFHPGVHFVCHQIRFERELACDQLALQSSGNDVATYADTLVRVVGQFSAPDSFRMLTRSRVELSTFWKRRMNMLPKIARLKSGLSRRSRWSLLLCGLAVLALPTWHQQVQSQEDLPGKGEKKPADKLPARNDNAKSRAVPGAGPNTPAVAPTVAVRRPVMPPMAPPSVEYLPEPLGVEKQILETLGEQVDFVFTNESLDGIVATLAEKHGLQVVIVKVKLEEESIATDVKDISLKFNGISLRSGLNILLKAKNLTFFIEDEVIKLTTITDEISIRPTRTYPVRDLVGNVDVDYQLLSEAIQQSTSGPPFGPWMDADGEGGSISILPATGCLVVRQTAQGHDEVLKLLRALRKANAEMQVK